MPSVSQTRVKRWSFKDLLILRAIHWLRHPMPNPDGEKLPPVPELDVRAALAELDRVDLDGCVTSACRYASIAPGRFTSVWRTMAGPTGSRRPHDSLDLIKPFELAVATADRISWHPAPS